MLDFAIPPFVDEFTGSFYGWIAVEGVCVCVCVCVCVYVCVCI